LHGAKKLDVSDTGPHSYAAVLVWLGASLCILVEADHAKDVYLGFGDHRVDDGI
jgi:hypothetical protein